MLRLNLRRDVNESAYNNEKAIIISTPRQHNESWSRDFMSDAVSHGHRFRTLIVLGDFNRQALAIELDTSLTAARVIRALKRSLLR